MSDTLELRDVRAALRRRWWLPFVLALAAAGLGVVAAANVAPVYKSQGTLLVGPVNGTVIRSSTLRASESLATFYSDLARRQVVLEPVTRTLGLGVRWDQLRDHVSAVTPDQNPRLIMISVLGRNRTETRQTADQILRQLVSLSPNAAGGNEQQFVSEQTTQLKATIEKAEVQVSNLSARLARSRDPQASLDLRRQLTEREKLLNEWRLTYVELMAVDLSTDAGGLQVIDDVTTAKSSNTDGMIGQGALGGAVGVALGVVLVWLLHRRRRPVGPAETALAETAERDQAPVAAVEPEKSAATAVEPEKTAVAAAEPAKAPAQPVEPDKAPVATASPETAVNAEPESTVVAMEEPDQEPAGRVAGKVATDRVERVRAAMRPPEGETVTAKPDKVPARQVEPDKLPAAAAEQDRPAQRNKAQAEASEPAKGHVRKVAVGTVPSATGVQLVLGQNGSGSIAIPVHSER